MNRLAEETSPYLLQHKDNPVHWYAWCDEAWEKARRENKLVLVSIGYSACHWCHVMEHEVFEDFECAEFMNMHFVCIKVDREERPDVDSWFMDAVHLMGSQGGWPLNVFTLPDGRPVYGGTYFPKPRWIELLENLRRVMLQDSSRAIEYAAQLHDALTRLNERNNSAAELPGLPEVHGWIENWSKYWDLERGGNRKAPKFPMPNNWELLLNYAQYFKSETARKQVKCTLDQMAMGGIYDQLGGGFARYSVDAEWKVPHFEKMLYDNAQLVSLYAQACRASNDKVYESIVEDTLSFINREWKSPDDLYYAALDADSDGAEGTYYVWTESELDELLGDDAPLLKKYFGVGSHGYWEHDVSVLCMRANEEEWCRNEQLDAIEWRQKLHACKAKMLEHRNKRTKPGLDDKCIASWNAMLARAFVEAAKIQGRQGYLNDAEKLLNAIYAQLMQSNGLLAHARTKGKVAAICLLEDQVFFIDALLSCYEISGKEQWLVLAAKTMQGVEEHFSSTGSVLFLNRPHHIEDAIGAKLEVNDNVIPAANGVACRCLLKLGRYLGKSDWHDRAERMLKEVSATIDFAPGFSNWILALLELNTVPVEVVFTGPQALGNAQVFHEKLNPFVLSAASTASSELPLFNLRGGDDSPIYVCRNQSCDVPVYRVEDVII